VVPRSRAYEGNPVNLSYATRSKDVGSTVGVACANYETRPSDGRGIERSGGLNTAESDDSAASVGDRRGARP
jgi:hypothetical protein